MPDDCVRIKEHLESFLDANMDGVSSDIRFGCCAWCKGPPVATETAFCCFCHMWWHEQCLEPVLQHLSRHVDGNMSCPELLEALTSQAEPANTASVYSNIET
eukprot:15433921-Alexandrium_andersonii.AAC.1